MRSHRGAIGRAAESRSHESHTNRWPGVATRRGRRARRGVDRRGVTRRHRGEAEAGAELAGELSGDTLESKFLALEAGGANDDDALAELKAKMGLLEAPKSADKMLKAGDDKDETPGAKETATAGGLSAEDLKELEDLDLSDLEPKAEAK